MKTKIIAAVITGIVLAGGIFWSGVKYGKAQMALGNSRQSNGQFSRGQFGVGASASGGVQRFGRGGGILTGEIISQEDNNLTLKLDEGGSRLVLTTASTSVFKMEMGSLKDLNKGTKISVQGKVNEDGSLTAQSVQIRPADLTPLSSFRNPQRDLRN